ncbi:MAG: ChuX/HutX family heme-like substrate-binding protein, partial [Cetobacterium sp.]
MKKRIQNILDINEKASLSKISSELEISMIEVLRNAPTVRTFDVKKIDDLFEVLREWEQVFLLVVTPNFVLEIKDKFPKGFYAHGFLNFHDKTTSIGGHLSVG